MLGILLVLQTWIVLQIAGLTAIAESNRLTKLAGEAMKKGQYALAARDYARMADELGVKDDAVLANLGQAYLRQDDYANATRAYTRLSLSKDAGMRSLAHAQLGVIASRQKNPGEAASQLKEAIRQDPNNQLARMNLVRLLKRDPKLEPPKNQQNQQNKKDNQEQKQGDQNKQDQQKEEGKDNKNGQKEQPKDGADKKEGNKEGEKRDQKDKEQGNQQGKNNKKAEGQTQQGQEQNKAGAQGNGQNKDEEEGKGNEGKKPKEDINGQIASREQLAKMQMTEARARQLLEAMRTSEVQYLQQRRHRRTGNSGSNGKPTW